MRRLAAARRQACGALAGVPHSAQNLAAGLSSAAQFAHWRCIAVPQESQNFAPSGNVSPQAGQPLGMCRPHSRQNLAPVGFSRLQ